MKVEKKFVAFLIIVSFLISCKKEFSYEGGTISSNKGTWQFSHASTQYIGNIDSAYVQDFFGTKVLTLVGKSLSGTENFSIHLYTTDSFTTGTYMASSSQSDFDYFSSTASIFNGDFLAGEFTVTVSSLSNNYITGTFSGTVEDSTGAQTQITLGSFTSVIDLTVNGSGGSSSIGSLGVTADSCTPVLISGTFTKGTDLTISNTVQVKVNVTSPGTYIIATNTVNGVYFYKAGTFNTTGLQDVVLQGSGVPQNEGIEYFTVTYGPSNCNFHITFLPGSTPTGDYFPATITSSWAYGLEGGVPEDSLLTQVIPDQKTINGNVFTSFITENIPPTGNRDTAFFRKSGGDYFTYEEIGSKFQFDDPVFGEFIFLKDNVPALTTYASPSFNGLVAGVPSTGFIQITILEKGVPASVGSLNFSDVIKVKYEYTFSALGGLVISVEEKWFARGVGLIYDNTDDTDIYNIGRYSVN